jgi:AcrR family transcriptional regulator
MFDYSRSSAAKSTRKHPVQARSRETVATILEAAAHVLERRGYVGLTTNHVAARAGVSIGSIYQYFPDKDALLAALTERDVQAVQTALLAVLENARRVALAPADFCRALVRAWCDAHADAHQHVLYAVSAALPGVRQRAELALGCIAAEIAWHLRRWRVPSAALRARVLLLICFSLVHELVIALPHGAARRRAEDEAVEAMAAYLRSALPPHHPAVRRRRRARPASQR